MYASSNTLSLYNTELSMNAHFGGGSYGLQLDSGSYAKLVMQGSSSPYIQFREATTDRAYIQYNSTNNALQITNQETSDTANVGISIPVWT